MLRPGAWPSKRPGSVVCVVQRSLRSLLASPAGPGPARPVGGEPRQPRRPHRRGRARGLAREAKGLRISLAGAECKIAQIYRRRGDRTVLVIPATAWDEGAGPHHGVLVLVVVLIFHGVGGGCSVSSDLEQMSSNLDCRGSLAAKPELPGRSGCSGGRRDSDMRISRRPGPAAHQGGGPDGYRWPHQMSPVTMAPPVVDASP